MARARFEFARNYLTLRLAVGVLGLVLPFALWWGGASIFGLPIQPTISDYHATGMRDVFVGILVSLGVFLYAYRGQDRLEDWSSSFAGLCAVTVAWFPNQPPTAPVHFLAAGLFFGTLAFIAFFLWPRTEDGATPTLGKLRRNQIYHAMGAGIALCVLAIAVQALVQRGLPAARPGSLVFWLETGAVVCFGVAWLVKGEALKHLNATYFLQGETPATQGSADRASGK